MRSAAPFDDRHPEVRASKSAFTRVFDALWRAIASRLVPTCASIFRSRVNPRSVDERPPPLPLATPAAIAGPSPFEARARALAPQGDGERESRSAAIGVRRREG